MKPTYRLLERIAPMTPLPLRRAIHALVSLPGYDLARRASRNPYLGQTGETFSGSPACLGILKDVAQSHRHYIAACREMNVSYKVLDLLDDDWVSQVRASKCDAFLVWPSSYTTVLKSVFDYRLKIMEEDLGLRLYPTWKECWLTEHKPRLRDWLDAKDIPHPRTWVFHSEPDALALANVVDLPVVLKTATGASGHGVWIVRNRAGLIRQIKKAFRRGLLASGYDPRDRQRGFVYLQEYLPNVEEWRMVRIGDSFFGHRKDPGAGGLHSGSGKVTWSDPGPVLLSMLKRVTDAGTFTSMNVDVFCTQDGRLLVNECQALFGCSIAYEQMMIDGVAGRYVAEGHKWRFEAGAFCQNHMCNLRIQHLLANLKSGQGS